MKTLTPAGVQDLTPEETKKLQNLLKKTAKIAEKSHYLKVRTPIIEYEDTLLPGLDPDLKAKTIRFLDNKGQTLLLRPDNTAPIARLVATQLKDHPKPLRLYYQHPVFQASNVDSHRDIEIFQTGVEHIGQEGPEADAEVIMILIEMCLSMGLKDVGVDIGHTQFLKGLSKEKKDALLKGDYIRFGKIPERGGPESIQNHPDLIAVYNIIKKNKLHAHVHFNKGLVKELSYYTGIIFEAYFPGCGQSIASGGRYDDLIEKFGYKAPAVGFAINMNMIQEIRV